MKLDDETYIMLWFVVISMGILGVVGLSKMSKRQAREKAVERYAEKHIVEIEYKGHQYLEYRYSIEHDPDCPCWTNRLEKQHARNQ